MECQLAKEQIENPWQHVVPFCQLSLAILTIISNIRLHNYSKNYSYFHKSLKLFFQSTVVINVFQSIIIIVQMIHHLIAWQIYEPCKAMSSGKVCLSFRAPIVFCFTMNSLLHCGMSIERSLATYRIQSQSQNSSFDGYFILSLMIAAGLGVTTFAYRRFSLSSLSIFCTTSTTETINDVTTVTLLLALCDVIAFIYTVVLYFINARQKGKLTYGNIEVKSQRMENDAAYKLLMPLIVFHLTFFLTFNLAVASLKKLKHLFSRESDFQVFISSLYVVPIYTFVSPLIMQHIMVRGARLRKEKLQQVRRVDPNQNDTYFNMYRDMWNQP